MDTDAQSSASSDFDFEVWAALVREDPDAFERKRREAIDALIASSPAHRRRLEGMQFRIDMERKLAHTPLKACLRMSAMMWDSFLELKTELAELGSHAAMAAPPRPRLELVGAGEPQPGTAAQDDAPGAGEDRPARTATVLAFARKDGGGNEE